MVYDWEFLILNQIILKIFFWFKENVIKRKLLKCVYVKYTFQTYIKRLFLHTVVYTKTSLNFKRLVL